MSIDIGDTYRAPIVFTDENAAPADPSTVVVKVQKPGGVETTYTYITDAEVVKDSTGNYHIDIVVDVHGGWAYRWEGSGGSVTAADEKTFYVRPSKF